MTRYALKVVEGAVPTLATPVLCLRKCESSLTATRDGSVMIRSWLPALDVLSQWFLTPSVRQARDGF